MTRWAGQWSVLTSEKSPFTASLHPFASLCRNGKMECVPEDKGNLPPPHSQQSSPSGCKLPYVCSCFSWLTACCSEFCIHYWTLTRRAWQCRGGRVSGGENLPQLQGAERRRGLCTNLPQPDVEPHLSSEHTLHLWLRLPSWVVQPQLQMIAI